MKATVSLVLVDIQRGNSASDRFRPLSSQKW